MTKNTQENLITLVCCVVIIMLCCYNKTYVYIYLKYVCYFSGFDILIKYQFNVIYCRIVLKHPFILRYLLHSTIYCTNNHMNHFITNLDY